MDPVLATTLERDHGTSSHLTFLTSPEAPAVRAFCLGVIEEVFGHSYRPDWHADLDALGGAEDPYRPALEGCFLVARREGHIVGCAGLRALASRPDLVDRFKYRYPATVKVGSIWRVYVAGASRSNGLGRHLVTELERTAAAFGYSRLYLHTSGDTPRSVRFWEARGYETSAEDRDEGQYVVHMDKTLGPTRHPDEIATSS